MCSTDLCFKHEIQTLAIRLLPPKQQHFWRVFVLVLAGEFVFACVTLYLQVKARQQSMSRGSSYPKFLEEGRRSNGQGEEGRRRRGLLAKEEMEEEEEAYHGMQL